MAGVVLFLRTFPSLSLVLAHEKVLKQVADKLQRDILERKGRAVEQLEQVVAVLEVDERGGVGVAEGRVAAADNVLEVGRRDLVGGDVEGENLVGEVVEAEVLPGLPVLGRGDGLGDEETAIGGEALEDGLLKGELGRANVLVLCFFPSFIVSHVLSAKRLAGDGTGGIRQTYPRVFAAGAQVAMRGIARRGLGLGARRSSGSVCRHRCSRGLCLYSCRNGVLWCGNERRNTQ